MDDDLATGGAVILVHVEGPQLAIGQCSVRHVLEADTRLLEPAHRHRGDVHHARTAFDICFDPDGLDGGTVGIGFHGHGAHVVPAHVMTGLRRAGFRSGIMAHAWHVAMGHAHVPHGQYWHGPEGGGRGLHPGTRAECGNGLARPVNRFGDECIGPGLGWRDDHVIGFRNSHLKFIGLDRLDIQAVGLDHCHWQAREADIEEGHGGGVDDAQANPFARLEGHVEIVDRRMSIDEIGICIP